MLDSVYGWRAIESNRPICFVIRDLWVGRTASLAMHEQLLRLAHGIVAFPVIAACAERGLFELLDRKGPLTAHELTAATKANSGHLLVALRLLEALGWLERDSAQAYSLTRAAKSESLAPRDLRAILDLPLETCLTESRDCRQVVDWLKRSLGGWDQSDPRLAELADGLLLGFVLVALDRLESGDSSGFAGPLFAACCPPVRNALEAVFIARQWAEPGPDGPRATAAGRSLLERSLILGTTASYKPLLARLPELLFGDPRLVMQRGTTGEERHVERQLNVVASGFQHNKFFADLDVLVLKLFDNTLFEEQPRFVADMGCGDGTLLRRIFETVRDRSARGRALARYPVTMIGVDFNDAALEATAKTLKDIPHLLVRGDVGNPARLLADLKGLGIDDPDGILHVRSFLDHDRPYRSPVDAESAQHWQSAAGGCVAVDADGRAIPSGALVQSLVEHLRRWAEVAGKHGLAVLEVHSLAPEVAGRFMNQAESLHFDAYHGFSGQQLVDAGVYLLAAAAAGLFPRLPYAGRYPRLLPYARITCNWFEKRSYVLRPARRGDLTDLLELERQCSAQPMRMPAEALDARMEQNPGGQLVVEWDSRVVAVAYTQRIASVESLRETPFVDVPSLHLPNGPVIQLLGLNVLPDYQGQGLADEMLRFVLHWALLLPGVDRVTGVTRFRDYRRRPGTSIAEYLARHDDKGQQADPVVRFHQGNGAKILGLVPNYRPEDFDNEGCGVLIVYELRQILHELTFQETSAQAVAIPPTDFSAAKTDVAACVERCVRNVLRQTQQSDYAIDRPLKELGLDSLDLMELKTLLSSELSVSLEPTLFFRHPTPRSLCHFLAERLDASRQVPSVVGTAAPAGYHRADDEATEDSILERACGRARADFRCRSTKAPGRWPLPGRGLMSNLTDRIQNLSAEKQALLARRLAAVCAGRAPQRPESIAIVGIGCRFPGPAHSPEAFWTMLCDGVDAVTLSPPDRWDADAFYSPDFNAPGKMNTRWGGFVAGIDRFDAEFFGISPREAARMDPQQRLLLEVAWEALEQAGQLTDRLRGSQTGVFLGLHSQSADYYQLQAADPQAIDIYTSTGGAHSIVANRLSYLLDLQGPSLVVDTACSSSLVAIHLACQSLRSGESDLAVAGGVNLVLTPEATLTYSKLQMMAPDGRCKTFDARADGFVRSEGCGVVVLKRLSDALRERDPIVAVIRGSAVNQDGASNGLTAPNGRAQEALLRRALASARP